MNITLTIKEKNLLMDLPPRYSFKNLPISNENLNEAHMLFHHWLEKVNLNESVIVCFENFGGMPVEYLRNEQRSFLVSHKWEDIVDFVDFHLMTDTDYNIDFAVFEFQNYVEAFEFCKNLKEGF
tara:strand:- start:802 stop:1173 length:372 start_codon:yes stop_codon:yes gene_type:complete